MSKLTMRMLKSAFAGAIAFSAMSVSSFALAHSPSTTTTFSISPGNPVSDGTLVTFNGTVTISLAAVGHPWTVGQPVAGSTVKLQQYQILGVPSPTTAPGGTFVDISVAVTDASGNVSFMWDSTGYGGQSIGFRMLTLPQGGHNPGQSTSGAVDLTVTASGCTGVELGAVLAAGDGNPSPGNGTWIFRIQIHNCDLATREFKVQGGTNGWAPMTGFVASEGSVSVRNNNRNQVLTWNVTLDPGETQTLDVTVSGNIKNNTPDGTILFLSGAWSAAYVDDSGNPATTDYTGRVSVTVFNS
jgi:hypothetical protein